MRNVPKFLAFLSVAAAYPAQAQDAAQEDEEKIAALERRLEEQAVLLNSMKEELQRLKREDRAADAAVTPHDSDTNNPYLASGELCRLDSPDHINAALADGKEYAKCYTLSEADRPQYVGFFGERNRLLPGDGMTAQPGRPLQLVGVVPQLEFGSSGKASVTATVPLKTGTICGSDCRASNAEHRRYALTMVGSLKTDLSDGVGTFLDRRDRPDRRDLDYLGGTTAKLGFDYLQYDWRNGGATAEAIQKFIGKAKTSCLTAQHNLEIVGKPSDRAQCSEAKIVDWVFAAAKDKEKVSGWGFVNEALAEELKSLLSGTAAKEIPSWGLGASATVSNTDYKFQQGTLSETTDPDTGKASLVLDTSIPLAGKVEEGHRDYLAEGHFFVYANMDDPKRGFAPIWNVPGVMFVPQLSYRSFWEFRPGTKKSICSGGGTTVNVVSCADVQVDQPYRRSLSTGSFEARVKIEQVPIFGQLGFAPRFAYTFDDGGAVFDVPIYFTDSKGSMAAGVRYRHVEGGRDALGNRDENYDQLSIFFTPLRFDGF